MSDGATRAAVPVTLPEEVRAELRALAESYPKRRTALLPALKRAQQVTGHLTPAVMAEVAELIGVPAGAAQELSTFYSMLHTEPHGKLHVDVCVQLPCGFMGGERLLKQLSTELGVAPGETTPDGLVTLARTPECFGACHRAPMCRVNDTYVENLGTPEAVQALVKALKQGELPVPVPEPEPESRPKPAPGFEPVLLPHPGRTTAVSLEEYRSEGGYRGFVKALKEMTPAQVTEEVKASGLRGRGGAAFSTGLKWSFVPKAPGPKYLCCNADESEPGTFKDREIMEVEPHTLIEGVAIGSYAIGSNEAFIYIRGEYVEAERRLLHAIAEANAAGLLGKSILGTGFDLKIHVFMGAGAYICGEETALLESLEGRRPMPRSRPPFPAVSGLYDRPTVVNNVETLANVPKILAKGAGWYSQLGTPPKSPGTKIFCLSGSVNRPGNYELPLGAVSIRELIEQYGGGVRGGHKVLGVLPAGISAPIIPEAKLDAKLDYESIAAAGSMLGSASLIVLDETVDIVRAATRMVEFFRHESCGKCTPCREGTQWLHKIMTRIELGQGNPADLDLLKSLSSEISGKVLCALGDFATSPVTATIEHFRSQYLTQIGRRTPVPDWSDR
jgi:NADH-quinone oxidoreductase subunit F